MVRLPPTNGWILRCCVDDKSLDSCYKCDDFACEGLVKWASQNDGYTEALNRLRQMREAAA